MPNRSEPTRSNKLRVLVVGQTPPPYHGQGIMIQMLVDGQYERMQIRHIRMNFSQSLDEIGKVRMGKILHLISIILQIYWARLSFRPQILYYPPAGPNKAPLIRDAAILLATRFLFQRTVFHFQASGCSELIPTLSPKWQSLIRKGLNRPDLAIELSQNTVSDGTYLKAKKIVRIPNASPDQTSRFLSKNAQLSNASTAIDLNASGTEQSAMVKGDSPTPRILYLGTMCEGKGSLVLVEACRQLAELGLNFHVDFVGGYQPIDFRQEIEGLIAKHALTNRITLHGQLTGDHKWTKLASADLFCFPSHYSSEGFPVVLVEAMSFSLPIVSTYWRGIPDIVEDCKTGFLVPIQDAQQLAERIRQLIESPTLRHQFGKQAREKYLEQYTPEKHRELMEKAILSIR